MSAYSRWGSGSEGAEAVCLLWFVRYKAHWVSRRRIVISYHITLARCARRRAAWFYLSNSRYTGPVYLYYIQLYCRVVLITDNVVHSPLHINLLYVRLKVRSQSRVTHPVPFPVRTVEGWSDVKHHLSVIYCLSLRPCHKGMIDCFECLWQPLLTQPFLLRDDVPTNDAENRDHTKNQAGLQNTIRLLFSAEERYMGPTKLKWLESTGNLKGDIVACKIQFRQ